MNTRAYTGVQLNPLTLEHKFCMLSGMYSHPALCPPNYLTMRLSGYQTSLSLVTTLCVVTFRPRSAGSRLTPQVQLPPAVNGQQHSFLFVPRNQSSLLTTLCVVSRESPRLLLAT